MRATFAGLNTMVRGVMANQMALDTTGHNITNAGTEGYSRQSVILATTYSEQRASLYGNVMVGTGVDAQAVERARNIYADIQYRNENPSEQYYKTMAVNYDKLETIFDDSQNLGIEAAINKFYQTWVDLSTNASNSSARTQVIEQGRNLSDILQTSTAELQEQIRSEYEDLKTEVKQVDDILNEILLINKQVVTQEVTGAKANDLRDRRDLLVDQLSNYLNVSVMEKEHGYYQINSGGVTLVDGATRAHLVMSDGVSSSVYGVDYGITDYNIKIKESNMVFLPQNGILKARLDSISEDKKYIDKLADMASFMLTAFNDQHRQGWDIDGNYKFVDDNGDEVDASTVPSDNMAEYVDADGTYLLAASVGRVGNDYYNKTVELYEDSGKYYRDSALTDEVDADNVVYDSSGDKYYLKATKDVPTDTKYLDNSGNVVTKVPDTINFFGISDDGTEYRYQYRYDEEYKRNYLYKYDPNDATDTNNPNNKANGEMLSGVQIIAALEVNSKFSENRGDRYLATATSYDVDETQDANLNIDRKYLNKAWGNRTADGTNAVYLSELFNISQETIIEDGKANALISKNLILRNVDGDPIDAKGNVLTSDYVYSTSMSTLSLNSYYQKSMSTLGIDAYSTDVNYDAMQTIMTQITNWRDSTAGVDWNEELSNMIKFQKGFGACSRCLSAMDECLDRLVNSTGVVGR